MKDEKELKPASMRVRDAAESLLTIILEQVRMHIWRLRSIINEVTYFRLDIFLPFVAQKVCHVCWMK